MKSFFQLQLAEITKETNDCVSLLFSIPEEDSQFFKFKPGQHLTLRTFLNGEDIRRSYSICSAPWETGLRVGIKKVPFGKFSGFANEKLKAGDMIECMAPDGNFTLKETDTNGSKYVFFAAGSGITPVLSLIKYILNKQPESEVVLFYGNRSADTIIFKESLEGLKNLYIDRFSIYFILSQEKLESPVFNGRINKDKCQRFAKLFYDPANTDRFFLCGPRSMIFEIKDTLMDQGVPEEKIRFELFTSPDDEKYKDIKKPGLDIPDIASTIELQLDGKMFTIDLNSRDKSVLDAALAEGADLPYACKGGVCCTCKAKLLEGEVHMEVNYGLEPDELENGYILTCQSHPKSDFVKINFDV